MVKDRLIDLQLERSKNSTPKCIPNNLVPKRSSQPLSIDVEFLSKTSEVAQLIDELSTHVREFESLYKDVLANPQRNTHLEVCMTKLTCSIKEKAVKTRGLLKSFELNISESSALLDSTEMRMKVSQYAAFNRLLQDVLCAYNKCQLDYREKSISQIRGKLAVAGSRISEADLEDLLEQDNPEIFTNQIMASTDAAKLSLRAIEVRHNQLMRLEKSIQELRELFQTVAITVENQSDLINNVESRVRQATDRVECAKKRLSSAKLQQKRSRRCKLICAIISVVVAVILFVSILSTLGL